MSQQEPIQAINTQFSNSAVSQVGNTDPKSASQRIAVQGDGREAERSRLAELTAKPKLMPQEILEFYNSTRFNDFRQDAVSLILSLPDSGLDSITGELLSILRSELGQETPRLNIYFIGALIARLSEAVQGADQNLRNDFQQFLRDVKNHQNQIIQEAVARAQKTDNSGFKRSVPANYTIHQGEFAVTDVRELQALSESAVPLEAGVPDVPMSAGEARSAAIATADNRAQALHVPSRVPGAGIGAVNEGILESVNLKGERVISAQDGSLSLREQAEGAAIWMELYAPRVAAHATATKMGVPAAIVTLGNLGPTLVVAPIIDYLLVRLGRIDDKKNLYKFAIVSDSVASVVKLDKRQGNLRLVDSNKELSKEDFYDVYKNLLEEGYVRIISLHLSPKLGRSYEYAKDAAQEFEDAEITVINSHANGLGLGLMIQEINKSIMEHDSPQDVFNLIHDWVHNLSYWVVPVSFNYVRNQNWLNRIANPGSVNKLRQQQFVPIFSLKEKITLVASYNDSEKAVIALMKHLNDHMKSRSRRARRVGVEYRRLYRPALGLSQKIRDAYPGVEVSTHLAGSITNSYFGPDMIGVCVI